MCLKYCTKSFLIQILVSNWGRNISVGQLWWWSRGTELNLQSMQCKCLIPCFKSIFEAEESLIWSMLHKLQAILLCQVVIQGWGLLNISSSQPMLDACQEWKTATNTYINPLSKCTWGDRFIELLYFEFICDLPCFSLIFHSPSIPMMKVIQVHTARAQDYIQSWVDTFLQLVSVY